MDPSGPPVFRFGDFEVDIALACLRQHGLERDMRPKAFQVLHFLIANRHRLVSKEELFARVWPDTAVTDDALVQVIVELRRVLGDDSRTPRFVKTIPRLGYRFVGQLIEPESSPAAVPGDAPRTLEAVPAAAGARSEEDNRTMTAGAPSWTLRRRVLAGAAVAGAAVIAVLGYAGLSFRLGTGTSAAAVKTSVAVMSFTNQSNSAEFDWLREGLADMLATDFARSRQVTVVDRERLRPLERSASSVAGALEASEAVAAATQARATTVLLGSFATAGDKIRIDVRLIGLPRGDPLATESFIADRPDQILSQVDLLSLKLATDLGVADRTADRRGLAEARTSDLEAYRAYTEALEKASGLHNVEAIDLLKRAVARDPQFAMAYARIGYVYAISWNHLDEGKPYLEQAFALANRLSERERLSIGAWYAVANHDFEGAIRSLRDLVRRYPLEGEAYLRLGNLLRGQERYDEAITALKQGVIVDPDNRELYNVLGHTYGFMGQGASAILMHQRYVALAPNEPNAYDSLGLSYQWVGQYEAARAQFERALALNPHFEVALVHMANLHVQRGQYREAFRWLEQYERNAPSDSERGRAFADMALIRAKQGRLADATRLAEKAASYDPSQEWKAWLIALEREDWAAVGRFERDDARDGPLSNRGMSPPLRRVSFLMGLTALKRHQDAAATAHFREAVRHMPMYWEPDSFEDCLANGLLQTGKLDEAIAEYDRVLAINPNYPLARYHLAKAYDRRGDRVSARDEYERFIRDWESADRDVPQLQDARARIGRVAGS